MRLKPVRGKYYLPCLYLPGHAFSVSPLCLALLAPSKFPLAVSLSVPAFLCSIIKDIVSYANTLSVFELVLVLLVISLYLSLRVRLPPSLHFLLTIFVLLFIVLAYTFIVLASLLVCRRRWALRTTVWRLRCTQTFQRAVCYWKRTETLQRHPLLYSLQLCMRWVPTSPNACTRMRRSPWCCLSAKAAVFASETARQQ